MSDISRFNSKCKIDGDCVRWVAAHDGRGYGQFYMNKRTMRATHAAFYFRHGRLPSTGKMLCHKCDNKWCVNPDHLYEGTQVENQRDVWNRANSLSPVHKMNQAWQSRTQCKNGHSYKTAGIKMKDGYRLCAICYKDSMRRSAQVRRQKRIEAALTGKDGGK